MSLANRKTARYVVRRITSGSLPDAIVADGNHNHIGKITGSALIEKKIRLLDSHYTMLVESAIKETPSGRIYIVRDLAQNLLGMVKIKKLSKNLKGLMQNSGGAIILSSDGPEAGPFRIKDGSGSIIASILTNAKNSEKLVTAGHSIALQVSDLSFPRKSLLGFFISIYNNLSEGPAHVQRPKSALESF